MQKIKISLLLFLPLYWPTQALTGNEIGSTNVSLQRVWARDDLSHQFEAQGICVRAGYLYIGQGGPQATIVKLEIATGRTIWSHPTGNTYQPSYPVSNGKVVVFGTYYEHFIVGLDDATGKELWKVPTAGQNMSAATFSGGTAFIGSYDKHIHAIDSAAGKEKWKTLLGGPIWSVPCVSSNRVFIGCYDGNLYGLDQASGNIVMKVDCGGRIESDPVPVNKLLLLSVDDQAFSFSKYQIEKVRRTILAIDTADGRLVSRIASESTLARRPVVDGDDVYFYGRLPIYAYDTKQRRLAWNAKKPQANAAGWPLVFGFPLVFEKTIVLPMNEFLRHGEHTSCVMVLDRVTGRELLTSDSGGIGAMQAAYFQEGDLLIITCPRLNAYRVLTN